ncbi:MAG: M48 family metallopeptidase [Candidatus Eutrophobiaceae bacterium]
MMDTLNFFSLLFLACLAAGLLVEYWLSLRHIAHVRRHRDAVPDAFRDKVPLEAHQKAADYNTAKVRFNLCSSAVTCLLAILWTLGGGLEWMDDLVRALDIHELLQGMIFIIAVFIIAHLLELPLSAWRAFGVEKRFGFNRMTIKLMLSDELKNGALMLIFGAPLSLLALWLMDSGGALWWVWAWGAWFSFSLFMMWAWPAFIAPLFNRFRPLENPELEQRIIALLERNGFSSSGILVMDGSSRSTHGNAYFTGLGTNKRIVFFDTLINELSHDEIEAVLAHELGHFKCNHIKKRIALLGGMMLVALILLGALIEQQWFYTGLGVSHRSNHQALMLFMMILPAFTGFLQPFMSWLSRQHEFEADDFAATQAQTSNLISALVSLYRENANTLTPDPLYSAFNDSHPPASVRIAHLQRRVPSLQT